MSDNDGYCSSAIMWNYIKKIYPHAKLHFVLHEGKGHGLSDLFDRVNGGQYRLIILPDAGRQKTA